MTPDEPTEFSLVIDLVGTLLIVCIFTAAYAWLIRGV